MKKYLLILCVIFSLTLFLSCELITPIESDIEVYGLFVGLDYDLDFTAPYTSLNPLEGTIPDAKEMAVAMASLYQSYDIPFHGYLSLQSELDSTERSDALYPSEEKIRDLIGEIGENMDDNDIFIFYFAGHGIDNLDLRGSLIVAPEENEDSYTLLTIEELSESINALPGNHVVILDSCYSGEHVSPYPSTQEESSPYFDAHTFSLVASKDDQTSKELELGNGEIHGYFTLAFLDYLGWEHSGNTSASLYVNDDVAIKADFSVTGHIKESSLTTIALADIANSIQKRKINSKYDLSALIGQHYTISSGPTDIILFDSNW